MNLYFDGWYSNERLARQVAESICESPNYIFAGIVRRPDGRSAAYGYWADVPYDDLHAEPMLGLT